MRSYFVAKMEVFLQSLMKDCAMGFYKGVLLSDPQKNLMQQGNMQSDQLINSGRCAQ
jgi:uncharacterized protein YdeI (YjbR/CyaY-like superfamily)